MTHCKLTLCSEVFAPDFVPEIIPPWMFLPSPRNITVERGWCPLMETWGVNILHYCNQGRYGGYYHLNDEWHQLVILVI